MKDLILKHTLINAIEHSGRAEIQAVLNRVIAEDSNLRNKIKEMIPEIRMAVEEINSLSTEEQGKRLAELGVSLEKRKEVESGLPELPDAEKGKVVMRVAPYPSGPLHIGNARMIILNDEYVKRYGGRLFLVFDDTIGSEEKFILPEAYDLIFDGLKWLGVKFHRTIYKSDRLKFFYKFTRELIQKELAYVCECDVDTLRKNRVEGIECEHREQSEEDNLEKWDGMLRGSYKEGGAAVRLKTDMKYPDPAFRDRVLARIVNRKHPRVGAKYKVWPTLELSWAVDDQLLGVTHILRGKQLVIEDMMEEFIWERLGLPRKHFIHHGMLSLKEAGAKLSKSETRKLVKSGKLSGWDDPRTWSLQSLRRRGIQPEAVRRFVVGMGLSLADVTAPAEILYSENRKIIDSIANRFFAVLNPVMISVKNAPEMKNVQARLHPDFPKRGTRKIPIDVNKIYIERDDFEKFKGKEVGLMDLFTVKLDKKSEFVSKEVKYEVPKIQWVSEPNTKIKIMMPDGVPKKALAEPNIKKTKVDQIIQMVRVGFSRIDRKGKEMILYFTHK